MPTHSVPAADAPALHVRFDDTVPILTIPKGMRFEALRAWIREALPEHASRIGGRSCRLDIGDREIKLFDLRRLIHLLRDEFSVEIKGLYVRPAEIQKYAERELKLKLFPTDGRPVPPPVAKAPEVVPQPIAPVAAEAPAVPEVDDSDERPTEIDEGRPVSEDAPTEIVDDDEGSAAVAPDDDEVPGSRPVVPGVLDNLTLPTDLEPRDLDPKPAAADLVELATEAPRRNSPDQGRRTLTVHRTLRSGAIVRFDGDVILFGDVNPGANVIATGNVVVLGALKGMAHAGALGDEAYTILAFDFRPTQVRIGRKIAIPPSTRKSVPELAAVRGGEIVIEPYSGRFR